MKNYSPFFNYLTPHLLGQRMFKLFQLQNVYRWSGKLLPVVGIITLGLFVYGLIGGLFLSPADYQQGEVYRILYVHVPAAFFSLGIYSIIFVCSILYLVWQFKLADIVATVSAPIGAIYTVIALITGSLWGKPMWGTWWVWDARLTSELVLLFLYFGYIALRAALKSFPQSERVVAILAVVGMVDVPIVHYSVKWWTTLHQGSSFSTLSNPSIAAPMLYPLLAMLGAFAGLYGCVTLISMRTEILSRERFTRWVQTMQNMRSMQNMQTMQTMQNMRSVQTRQTRQN